MESEQNTQSFQPGPSTSTFGTPVAPVPTTQQSTTEQLATQVPVFVPTLPVPVLNLPISRLQVMVEVADRYKNLFTQLLFIYQDMYEKRDKRLLFDIQPMTAYIRPEKAEGFKNLLNEIRNHLGIPIRSSMECKKRLIQIRPRFTNNDEIDIIDGALDLLNLPSSSEITSDADFKLLALQQSVTDIDTAIEIQEIFIYLNSLFQPLDETTPPQPKPKSNRGPQRSSNDRRR